MSKEQFPDKKRSSLDFRRITDFLKEGGSLSREFEVGQKEGTWIPNPEYPQLPVVLLLASDMHYGSIETDYDLLDKHLKVVDDTPNFYLATNGDHVDFFNPVTFPKGMFKDSLPPQIQARAFMNKLLSLDAKSKVAVLCHGNHDNFGDVAGYDFYDSFVHGMAAPIFHKGGILNIVLPGYNYRMVINHTYWGKSKINITNAPKRLIEYEGGGNVDIGWLGHTHQSSYEHFTKGNKELLAIVSGTYKTEDSWAAKKGISMKPGLPGICVMLWPKEKKMQAFKDIETVQQFMLSWIFKSEADRKRLARNKKRRLTK